MSGQRAWRSVVTRGPSGTDRGPKGATQFQIGTNHTQITYTWDRGPEGATQFQIDTHHTQITNTWDRGPLRGPHSLD